MLPLVALFFFFKTSEAKKAKKTTKATQAKAQDKKETSLVVAPLAASGGLFASFASPESLICMGDAAEAELTVAARGTQSGALMKIFRDALLAKVDSIEDAFFNDQAEGYDALEALFKEFDFCVLWNLFTAKNPNWALKFGTTCECEDTHSLSVFTALLEQPQFTLTQKELYALLSTFCGERMINMGAAKALLIGGANPKVQLFRELLALTPKLDAAVRASLCRNQDYFDLQDDTDKPWLHGFASSLKVEIADKNKNKDRDGDAAKEAGAGEPEAGQKRGRSGKQ